MKPSHRRAALVAVISALTFSFYSPISQGQDKEKADGPLIYGEGGMSIVLPRDPGSPDTLDELLNDPLFTLEPDHDFTYYSKRWSVLNSRLHQLTGKRTTDLHNSINPLNATQQERKDMLNKIYELEREYTSAFNAKAIPIFTPFFKKFAFDDSLAELESARAFAMYVAVLAQSRRFDELAELRDELLKKEQELKEKEDSPQDEAQRITQKIRQLNDSLYNPLLRLELDFRQGADNSAKAPQVKIVCDELVEALKKDPRLSMLCDNFYAVVGRSVDSKLAREFREAALPYYNLEVAREEVGVRHGGMHSVADYSSILLAEPYELDESMFEIPLDESNAFYNERLTALEGAMVEYERSVHTQKETREMRTRNFVAQNKVKLLLALNAAKSGEQIRVRELVTTPFTTAEYERLQADFAQETKKPLAEWRRLYVDALSVVILSHELQRAIQQSDEETLKVGDKIIKRALAGGAALDALPLFLNSIYLSRNRDVARQFVERVGEKFSHSTSVDASIVKRLENELTNLSAQGAPLQRTLNASGVSQPR